MTTDNGWWTAGADHIREWVARLLRRSSGQPEVTVTMTERAPVDAEAAAPDCANLSKFIRLVCAEPKTSSVWWVVVTDSSAIVYPLPADHSVLGGKESVEA